MILCGIILSASGLIAAEPGSPLRAAAPMVQAIEADPAIMGAGQTGLVDAAVRATAIPANKLAPRFAIGNDAPAERPNHPPLHLVPPMPMPAPPAPGFIKAAPGADTSLVYDAQTRRTVELPANPLTGLSGLTGNRGGGAGGADGGGPPPESQVPATFANMTRITSTGDFPWRMNCKLLMRFVDRGGNNLYFVCSGSMIEANVVLCAAHCVFLRGNNTDDWAREIWVYPGWDGNGTINPPDTTINTYGWARGTYFLAGSDYINNGNTDRDCGLICIGRPVGMLTGWFGWAWGYDCATIQSRTYNNSSFPAEGCGSPGLHNGRDMYYWFGGIDSCPGNQARINTSGGCFNAGWGGMSGSSAYWIDGDNRFAHAVASTSDRATVFNFCKLWEQFTLDMNNTFIPTCRGTTFDLQPLDGNFGPTVVQAGSSMTLQNHLAANATGGTKSGTHTFTVYLSANDNISSGDTPLSTQSYTWNFAAASSVRVNMASFTIPLNTPPGTYWLGVEYEAATDANFGNNGSDGWDAVQITVTAPPAPPNDNFANRITLSGSSGATAGSNTGATKETGEPNHAGSAGGKSVWWQWTAPANGSAGFDTFGSTFDTLLAVYTGTAVNALTPIASNDDTGGFQSELGFAAVAGTSYKIAVDGFNGQPGDITLHWSFTLPTVTITASDASASETSPDAGVFTITRSAPHPSPLTVNFNIGGTASSGPDYAALGSSVTIPANASSTTLTVSPIDDLLVEGSETVIVTLAANAAYTVGSPASATVTIADNDPSAGPVPIAHWMLDETGGLSAVDSIGANHGTLVNGPLRVAGRVGPGAVAFDGVNDYINVPDSPVLRLSSTMSFAFWFNPSQLLNASSGRKDILQKFLSYWLLLNYPSNDGKLTFILNSGSPTVKSTTASWSASTWYHVAATYDGAQMKLYVNGLLEGTAAASVAPVGNANPLQFGGNSSQAFYFPGALDDVRLYGQALTAAEVASLYGGGPVLPTVTITATDPNAAEPSDPGQFTVTRTDPTTAALTVNFTVGGTASSGVDYTSIGASVVIPATAASVPINVTVIDDLLIEGSETVIATLAANAAYTIGSPASATVTIADDDQPTTVTVAATDATAGEPGTGQGTGTFTFSRTGSTAAALTANFTVGGTAISSLVQPDQGPVPARQAVVLDARATEAAPTFLAPKPSGPEAVWRDDPAPSPSDASVPSGQIGGAWTSIGPAPTINAQVNIPPNDKVCGAIQAIAAHPTSPDILYIGGVNGGIWRTLNATAADATWTPLTDNQASLSIGALEFDSTDATAQTLVAGSARLSSLGAVGGARIGVLRTTDGGSSWVVLGAGTFANENLLSVAARGAILMAASDTQWGGGSGSGLYRSINTGASFGLVSGGGTGLPSGPISDLVADPGNPNRFYAAVRTVGIFRSDDAGATWINVTAGIAGISASTVKIEMAVHDSGGGNAIYVGVVGSAGSLAGVWRSSNQGGSWTAMDVPAAHNGTQGAVHFSICADRTSPTIVYIGGDRITVSPYTGTAFRGNSSLALGSQFVSITDANAGGTAPHADSRETVTDANGNLIRGDDGGLYRRSSPQSNAGTWGSVIGNLAVVEAHDVAYDSVAKVAMAGTQDNGTHIQSAGASSVWEFIFGGDGGDVAIDDTSTVGQSIRYGSAQNLGGFFRYTYGAANNLISTAFPALTVLGGGPPISVQFITPITLNKVAPTRLIIGGANSAYESLNRGDSVTALAVGFGVNATFTGKPVCYGGQLAGVPNPDVLYYGSGTSVRVRTTAGGLVTGTAAAFPGGTVQDMVLDANDWQRVFVIDSASAYTSANVGASWANITGNLTGVGALHTLEFFNLGGTDCVVVGTDSGVYCSFVNDLGNWSRLGTGLPNAPVFDLTYSAVDNVLVAGTMGRGVFKIPASIAPGDYASIGTTVTFAPGSATATKTVTVIDDALVEGDETVVVTMATGIGYIVGTPASATVTIKDDDGPTVTITATDASASEPGDPGAFTVTRTGPTTAALTVNFTVGGTATPGADYISIGTSVIIPATAASAMVNVTVIDDLLVEGSETVIATLAANAAYTVGSPSSATVTITDNDPPPALPTVTITASDASAAEPADAGQFTITRTGSTAASLTVNFTVGGTATPGADYSSIGTSVIIPASQASAVMNVTVIDDALVEGSETVIATLAPNAAYTVGSPSSATVTIADNEPSAGPVPVARWRFDEASGTTALDSIGANHGTLVNGPLRVAGINNGALSFDGVNDYVNVPDAAALDLPAACSISLWFKPASLLNASSGRKDLLKKFLAYWILLNYPSNDGKLTFVLQSGSPTVKTLTSSWAADTWYHLVCTHDGSQIKIYVNGVHEATTATTILIPNNANPLQIGGNADQSFWFPGVMDEVRLYHTALSVAQVQSLYANPGTTSPALSIAVQRELSISEAEGLETSGTRITLRWKAEPGREYRLQFKDRLNDPEWQDVPGTIKPEGTSGRYEDKTAAAQRFYRVVELP